MAGLLDLLRLDASGVQGAGEEQLWAKGDRWSRPGVPNKIHIRYRKIKEKVDGKLHVADPAGRSYEQGSGARRRHTRHGKAGAEPWDG